MTELINKSDSRNTIRWKLLTGVSAMALAAYISSADATLAGETDRPIIWLEASGQLDQLSNPLQNWIPDFASTAHGGPLAGNYPDYQKTPRFGFDTDASLSFQPKGSDWVFSAAVRIGRARQAGSITKLANILPADTYGTYQKLKGDYASLYQGLSRNNESHLFVDFQAGRDVGIGKTEMNVYLGVRFAQMKSRLDLHLTSAFPPSYHESAFNHVTNHTSRNFQGVGPSFAWDGGVPVAGTVQDGELTLDWKANAAILFGRQQVRQKVDGAYTQGIYDPFGGTPPDRYHVTRQTVHSGSIRNRDVTVPDLGGSIGVSYRAQNVKVSLGYRAEYLFGVLDGGVGGSVVNAKNENRGFYGPYASISVGLGSSDN